MAQMRISNSGCVSNATYSALANARRNRIAATHQFKLVQLKKDGQPSKMYDAVQTFATEAEALRVVSRIRGLNPGKTLRWTLNGTEV